MNRAVEVYVRQLDGGGGVVRVSKEGGEQPLWSADGRELFYVDAAGHVISVPIAPMRDDQAEIEPGVPRVLFQARLESGGDRQYDVDPEGKRFVLNRIVVDERTPIQVIQNWTALLPKEER